MSTIFICTSEDMHPYECGGKCVHCRRRKRKNHDPKRCYLCHYFEDNWQPPSNKDETSA